MVGILSAEPYRQLAGLFTVSAVTHNILSLELGSWVVLSMVPVVTM